MKKRPMATAALGLLVLTGVSGDSEAGLFRRCRTRHQARQTYSAPACTQPAFGVPYLSTPQPTVQAPAPYQPAASPQAAPGEAAAFLAALNLWRARHGRPPVGWDATLAAFAATNSGVHSPGSSGGGSQAWAPTGSLTAALAMWQASPAHAAILLDAVTAVGASPSWTGMTLNAR